MCNDNDEIANRGCTTIQHVIRPGGCQYSACVVNINVLFGQNEIKLWNEQHSVGNKQRSCSVCEKNSKFSCCWNMLDTFLCFLLASHKNILCYSLLGCIYSCLYFGIWLQLTLLLLYVPHLNKKIQGGVFTKPHWMIFPIFMGCRTPLGSIELEGSQDSKMQLLTANRAGTYLGQPRASVLFELGNIVLYKRQPLSATCAHTWE